MRLIAGLLFAALLSGCATSAHDRRMAEAEGEESNTARNVKIGLAALAVGAILYAAAKDGGGGGAYAPTRDYGWEWDLQRAGSGYGLVWVCRGIQTGQYSDQSVCAGKVQTDWKWPGY